MACMAADELVEGLLALGFGGLDHDGAVNHQRKIDRRRVEAVVHQALGDIQGGDLVGLLAFVGEDAFVHAGAVKGQMVVRLQPLLDVVGAQDGALAGRFEVGPHAADVAVGPHQDGEIAVKGVQLADGLRKFLRQPVAVALFDHPRDRQKRRQALGHADRAGAGAAAAVGRGKGLVQVEVQHVHAQGPHVDDAHHGVHVGPVAVDQPALGVHDGGDLADVLLEQPQGVGVGDHDAGGVGVH